MRCKYSRVLSIIRERLHREPNDAELLIDNYLSERTIRKLTTQRNNSLHYDSDAGAEMTATFHRVIGTVKLHGSSVSVHFSPRLPEK